MNFAKTAKITNSLETRVSALALASAGSLHCQAPNNFGLVVSYTLEGIFVAWLENS